MRRHKISLHPDRPEYAVIAAAEKEGVTLGKLKLLFLRRSP